MVKRKKATIYCLGGGTVKQTFEEMASDRRKIVRSSLVRTFCEDPHSDENISPETWAKWRRDCCIEPRAHKITQYEAFLLICRRQWAEIKADYGLKIRSPKLPDLNAYGFPWLQRNWETISDRYHQILKPSQTFDDEFWAVEGRDLPKVLRDILGEHVSEWKARDRCLKLKLGYKRSQKYNWLQFQKILKAV
jgi:hypothetical protein